VNAETSTQGSGAVAPPAAAFPIVGIGASAGGLAAFEAFFSGMPPVGDPGMAFVLVQHLAPDHESTLGDLIRRYTRMPVFEVTDGMVAQPNCTYIIPPGFDMAFLNGALHLLEPTVSRGHRLPIDFFFRSLAQDLRERAIGIVLSGTGSDGTLGVRAIKGEGGMVMAQKPSTTEFDGMPRSALDTGLVDYELPPAEMPARLRDYILHAFRKPGQPEVIPVPKTENALKKIFILLRNQHGNDFSQYKPSTIHRRIERRMAVHQIDSIENYVRHLQHAPAEMEALFRDLLIGVTSFFRDPEAFKQLEERVIPKLFEASPSGSSLRVWSAGCSTGEEAYSLAILLAERMEALKQNNAVQVFATDIDSQAIATARAGLYPANIVADISKERLERYFTVEPGGGGYRVRKSIRDLILFSTQNALADPPFAKLDLVSCRNLMIYFSGDLQKTLLTFFHYALNPGGMLFLGTSETVGESDALFTAVDRKAKLYRRTDTLRSPLPILPGRHRVLPERALGAPGPAVAFPVKLSLRGITEQALLQKATPSGALVNAAGDILYLHGRTGMYLEPATGEVGHYNILKMAREGLRRDLATALHKATVTKAAVIFPGLRVRTNGHFTGVNLSVHPVASGEADLSTAAPDGVLYLVVLEEEPDPLPAAGGLAPSGGAESVDVDARIVALEQELHSQTESLQSANEELESSTEELKSSNEEMQSVNEELQSTNEELETSKEELQSVNEELLTVNTEMQNKVEELSRATNDLSNLLSGTGIGTVFVDHQLRIMRFTPTASAIINLIPSDLGRPVTHVVSNLVGYARLTQDVQAVLDTLVPKTVEVQTQAGAWYLMRILPYRTLDNMIEGAVISFVDITEQKKLNTDIAELEEMQAALRESEGRFRKLFVQAPLGIALIDSLTGQIDEVNPMFATIAGRAAEELARTDWMSITHPDDVQKDLDNMALMNAGKTAGFSMEQRYLRPDATVVWIHMTIARMKGEDAAHPRHFCMIEDITETRRAREALRKANEQLRLAVVVRDATDAITVQDLEGRTIAWNPGAQRLYGWSETEALSMKVQDRIPEGLREGALETLRQLARAEVIEPYLTRRITKDGEILEVSIISTALVNESGAMYAIATTERPRDPSKKEVPDARQG
jgi:two-component system CheB/CheR fusion protein